MLQEAAQAALQAAAQRLGCPDAVLCSVSVTRPPPGEGADGGRHLLVSRYAAGRPPLVAQLPLGDDVAPSLQVPLPLLAFAALQAPLPRSAAAIASCSAR